MSDVAIRWELANGDLVLDGADVLADGGLESAVILSLKLDARASADDGVALDADPRGWWGDSYPDIEGDATGSKLWLLKREKQQPAVAQRAQTYAQQALQWLIDDGVASAVTVTTQIGGGTLALGVTIQRPNKPPFNRQYQYVWSDL